jgi:hypothetical protein
MLSRVDVQLRSMLQAAWTCLSNRILASHHVQKTHAVLQKRRQAEFQQVKQLKENEAVWQAVLYTFRREAFCALRLYLYIVVCPPVRNQVNSTQDGDAQPVYALPSRWYSEWRSFIRSHHPGIFVTMLNKAFSFAY